MPGYIFIGVLANRIMPVDSIAFQIISYIFSLLMVINFANQSADLFFSLFRKTTEEHLKYCIVEDDVFNL